MASQAAIAVLCRSDGTFIDVLHDELGLTSCFQPGASITAIVEPGSLPEAVRLLREIREGKLVLDFHLDIALADTLVSLFVCGYQTDRGVHLIGAREPLTRESLFRELTGLTDQGSHGKPASGSKYNKEVFLYFNALLAVTAHDLRNHLNGILAASQYLLEDAVALLEPEHVTLLRSIESSSRATFGLIDDVLEVSTMELANKGCDLRPTDILALIKKSLSLSLAHADRKKVSMELVPPEAVPLIVADPVQIGRAIDTLLTNTIESSSPAGKIEISVAVKAERLMIAVRVEKTAWSAVRLRSLFQPSQSSIQGVKAVTVLGFRIMSRIVTDHGGAIHVDGDAGTGLTITVALPISGGQSKTLENRQSA